MKLSVNVRGPLVPQTVQVSVVERFGELLSDSLVMAKKTTK
jgi:hypothetical protein